jgi:hypothetical protein
MAKGHSVALLNQAGATVAIPIAETAAAIPLS